MDFLQYVDGGILSYRDGVIKSRIRRFTGFWLGRYDLKAEECVFLDDIQSNLDTAAGLGIHTILFRSLEAGAGGTLQLGVDSIY